ncbi:hypothetical protein EA58_18050 [Photobacterium galatheae]|uniref:Uncharacterized protein n=1 Tax=Photobacterium galatheae TaxID=1654360 RepID=A0A066RMA1_9GAMM|nr:hypothetical protein EA58_18050 [Photobacterium galatheae]
MYFSIFWYLFIFINIILDLFGISYYNLPIIIGYFLGLTVPLTIIFYLVQTIWTMYNRDWKKFMFHQICMGVIATFFYFLMY